MSDNDGDGRPGEAGEGNDPDYEVGYKKPPVATRFKKGHLGRPRGKTAARKSLSDEVLEQLEEMVVVIKNGERRKVPNRTALMDGLMADVLRGDARAWGQLMQLTGQADSVRPSAALTEDVKEKWEVVIAQMKETTDKMALETFNNASSEELIAMRERAEYNTWERGIDRMKELRDNYDRYTLDDAKYGSEEGAYIDN